MLPFQKRPRALSSIEILAEDLEPVELPPVRPPSVRPPSVRPAAGSTYSTPAPAPRPSRPAISFSSFGDDEMTVVRPDKRPSSAPPPRADLRMPRIPRSFAPRFDDDAPTELHSSARSLLSMSSPSSQRYVDDAPSSSGHWVPPPPPSTVRVEEPPPSAVAVDANASAGRQVDLSMTSSLSGTTDVRNLRRPTMGWAAGLVAVGVFAGLVAAFVARGDGLSAAASLVDPSQHASADLVKVAAAAQAPQAVAVAMRPGAAAPQAVQPAQPVQPVQAAPVQATRPAQAAPSCAADTAVAPVQAAVQAAEPAPVAEAPKVEAPKVIVAKPVEAQIVAAPRPVVRHVQPAAPRVVRTEVAERAPAPAVRHSSRHGGDVESASAADALAKAQLDAALGR